MPSPTAIDYATEIRDGGHVAIVATFPDEILDLIAREQHGESARDTSREAVIVHLLYAVQAGDGFGHVVEAWPRRRSLALSMPDSRNLTKHRNAFIAAVNEAVEESLT
jgi:hypothetical protein